MLVVCEGVPEIVDGDLDRAGQRGDVEPEVGGLGAEVPGTAVLPPGVHADALVPRRAPIAGERAPVRPRRQQTQPHPILSVLSGSQPDAGKAVV